MLGSLANRPIAYQTQDYQDGVPFAKQQFSESVAHTGVYAQTAPRLIGQYYFNTARPGMNQHTVVPTFGYEPVDFKDGTRDPLQYTWNWSRRLYQDSYVRGDQNLAQLQGQIPVNRARGIANSFTPELVHPITGESTNQIQFSFMPRYATAKQQQLAIERASKLNAVTYRRNLNNEYYWRNAHQSFRYSQKRG